MIKGQDNVHFDVISDTGYLNLWKTTWSSIWYVLDSFVDRIHPDKAYLVSGKYQNDAFGVAIDQLSRKENKTTCHANSLLDVKPSLMKCFKNKNTGEPTNTTYFVTYNSEHNAFDFFEINPARTKVCHFFNSPLKSYNIDNITHMDIFCAFYDDITKQYPINHIITYNSESGDVNCFSCDMHNKKIIHHSFDNWGPKYSQFFVIDDTQDFVCYYNASNGDILFRKVTPTSPDQPKTPQSPITENWNRMTPFSTTPLPNMRCNLLAYESHSGITKFIPVDLSTGNISKETYFSHWNGAWDKFIPFNAELTFTPS